MCSEVPFKTMPFKQSIIASVLMIATIVLLSYISRAEDIPLRRPLSTFPKQIGEWVGKEQHFDKRIYDVLGVDDSFLASYKSPNDRLVQLYMGYYQNQREGDLIHSPKLCMPGSGWNIIGRSLEELIIPHNNPGSIKVIKLLVEKGDQRQVVLYWFQSRGRFIASEYMQKTYLVIDAITRKRTDGTFMRILSPITDGNEENTVNYLKDFAKMLIPISQEFIPS
jgi:EpsI family protein